MRSFLISCGLFTLVLVFIIICGAQIKRSADELCSTIPDISSSIEEFDAKWKRSRGKLILSTDRNNITRIDSLIETARTFYNFNDMRGYADTLHLIKDTLLEIKRFEELTFSNII